MRDEVEVLLVMLDEHLPVPGYAHPGDAGADLVTAVDVELPPFGRVTVPTGVSIALPDGYAAFIHPRSGLAARHGVTIVNAPGTVDAGYRGEILVTLLNTDPTHPVHLRRGDRIAQLVVQRVERARFVREVADRGDRLDVGALWLPRRDGMELRMEVDKNTQLVTAASLQLHGSALQVQGRRRD